MQEHNAEYQTFVTFRHYTSTPSGSSSKQKRRPWVIRMGSFENKTSLR